MTVWERLKCGFPKCDYPLHIQKHHVVYPQGIEDRVPLCEYHHFEITRLNELMSHKRGMLTDSDRETIFNNWLSGEVPPEIIKELKAEISNLLIQERLRIRSRIKLPPHLGHVPGNEGSSRDKPIGIFVEGRLRPIPEYDPSKCWCRFLNT